MIEPDSRETKYKIDNHSVHVETYLNSAQPINRSSLINLTFDIHKDRASYTY